jgi:Zn-dependent protease with chaperone function
MILASHAAADALRSIKDVRHKVRIEKIVAAFRKAYPDIQYDIHWSSSVLNAQAFLWEGNQCVRLYGGLARHRGLSIAGIAWVLAHETGHHRGGPPFHKMQPHLSSEEQANVWAMGIGLNEVFGSKLARRYASFGRSELANIPH